VQGLDEYNFGALQSLWKAKVSLLGCRFGVFDRVYRVHWKCRAGKTMFWKSEFDFQVSSSVHVQARQVLYNSVDLIQLILIVLDFFFKFS
jgi:hypothetical protein